MYSFCLVKQIVDLFGEVALGTKRNILCFCRFLYPIYPLICVAASAFIESMPDLFRDRFDPNDKSLLVLVSFSETS